MRSVDPTGSDDNVLTTGRAFCLAFCLDMVVETEYQNSRNDAVFARVNSRMLRMTLDESLAPHLARGSHSARSINIPEA